jgi:hypothetical protein
MKMKRRHALIPGLVFGEQVISGGVTISDGMGAENENCGKLRIQRRRHG